MSTHEPSVNLRRLSCPDDHGYKARSSIHSQHCCCFKSDAQAYSKALALRARYTLAYIKGTRHIGIVFRHNNIPAELTNLAYKPVTFAFVDSNYATDPETRISAAGFSHNIIAREKKSNMGFVTMNGASTVSADGAQPETDRPAPLAAHMYY